MEGVTEVLGFVVLKWIGRDIRLSRPVFDSEVNYRAYLQREAAVQLNTYIESLSPRLQQAALETLTRDCTTGIYAIDGRCGRDSLAHRANLCELTWITLTQEKDQTNMGREECESLFNECYDDIFKFWERYFRPSPTTARPTQQVKAGGLSTS